MVGLNALCIGLYNFTNITTNTSSAFKLFIDSSPPSSVRLLAYTCTPTNFLISVGSPPSSLSKLLPMPGPLRPDRPIPPIHRGKPDVSSSVPGRKTKVAPSARTYPLSEAVVVSSDSEDEAAHEIEELQSHHKRNSETAVNTALTKRQRLPTSGPGQAAQDSSESEAEHPSQQSAEENSGSVTRVSESASSAAEDRSRAVSEAVSETESGGDSVEDRDATRERSNSDASEAQSGVDVYAAAL